MKKVYLIGNAHLDPVWLWRWQEGFAEIKATFRSALDRMNEFEDFKFTAAGSCYYMWIEKSDPKMFAEIQKRVAEGRCGVLWEVGICSRTAIFPAVNLLRDMPLSVRDISKKNSASW